MPSRFAQFEELDALAAVLGEYGRMLQCVPEFYATDITEQRNAANIKYVTALDEWGNLPTLSVAELAMRLPYEGFRAVELHRPGRRRREPLQRIGDALEPGQEIGGVARIHGRFGPHS